MRLISKFRDYYDNALAHGRDESVLYLRERSIEPVIDLAGPELPWNTQDPQSHVSVGIRHCAVINELVNKPKPEWKEGTMPGWQMGNLVRDCKIMSEAFVLVAGKAHPVWVLARSGPTLMGEVNAHGALAGCVDPQQIIEEWAAELDENRRPHKLAWRMASPSSRWLSRSGNENDRLYEDARRKLLEHDFTALHIEVGAPVILLAPGDTLYPRGYPRPEALDRAIKAAAPVKGAMILNPRLADLGFQKALHPYSCFQDISQFIGGVIPGHQMPMVTISDKFKVQKKGFDPKYGFRKRPAGMV